MTAVALALHIFGAVVWVGGMFAIYVCLRPALGTLEPPQRLRLMRVTFQRFFPWVWLAILNDGSSIFEPIELESAGGRGRVSFLERYTGRNMDDKDDGGKTRVRRERNGGLADLRVAAGPR